MKIKPFALGLVFMLALSLFSASVNVATASEAITSEYLGETVTFTETIDTPVFTHDEKKGNLQLDSYATYLAGTADFDYFVVTLYEADSNVEMGNKVALNTNGSDMAAWDVPSGKYYFRFEKPRNGLDLKVKYEVYPYNG
jgi:hypothetical protein